MGLLAGELRVHARATGSVVTFPRPSRPSRGAVVQIEARSGRVPRRPGLVRGSGLGRGCRRTGPGVALTRVWYAWMYEDEAREPGEVPECVASEVTP